MKKVRDRLLQQLKKKEDVGNFRSLQLTGDLVDFSSNDYLGLAKNQQLTEAIIDKVSTLNLPNGSTGSRLLSGNSTFHIDLEKRLAAYFQAQAALLFTSGYTANLALLSALPQRGDTVLYDQSIHACIKDGARLSHAKCLSFRHNCPSDLQKKLAISSGNKFVVVESLYSMEGDYPPIEEIADICRKHQVELIIDEAHTTGWVGSSGSGWVVEKKLQEQFLARVYTFGKGIGLHGACVVGSKELINYLINYARPFIYTTALPPHSVISVDCALSFVENGVVTGAALLQKINIYLQQASGLTLDISLNPDSPIQWVLMPGNERALEASKFLQLNGFDVRAIRSPTVPEGAERLRICLHSYNTESQIKDLLKTISRFS